MRKIGLVKRTLVSLTILAVLTPGLLFTLPHEAHATPEMSTDGTCISCHPEGDKQPITKPAPAPAPAPKPTPAPAPKPSEPAKPAPTTPSEPAKPTEPTKPPEAEKPADTPVVAPEPAAPTPAPTEPATPVATEQKPATPAEPVAKEPAVNNTLLYGGLGVAAVVVAGAVFMDRKKK